VHPDEEQLQRLLHGELSPGTERGLRDHLAECAECRDRLVAAKRDESEIFALLRQVDHPLPRVSAEAVAARALGGRVEWARWAAGILLLLGMAGAAYALPGSPVRSWVRSLVLWVSSSKQQPAAPSQPQLPAERAAGIAALPGPSFVIVFESPEPGGQARVSLTSGEQVTVRAPLGAANFTSAADRLVIDNQGIGATYDIEIPRAAPRVEIRVAGTRIFLKDSSRVVSDAVEERGSYALSLDTAGR
jgi:hypothetical protein